MGESGFHGDGATEQFKADLIPKLVEECGFNLILFEASFYEFAKINRDFDQGKSIKPADMATAIGGLWNRDQEVQDLITFMTDGANDGLLRVAGIDDQLGGRGQDYANYQMPKEVVQGLASSIADECQTLLERSILSNFPKDRPYSRKNQQTLLSCFSRPSEDQFIHSLRSNIRRYVSRDFDRENYFAGRANSMFQNFELIYDRLSLPPKTIIWTATVHAAKARGQLGGSLNTGTYIHQRFGDQAYVLGFSALGGQYRKITGEVLNVPEAPEDSIEFKAMSPTDKGVVFLDQNDLAVFGTAPASIYSYKYKTDDWSKILDGLVVFREQRPTMIIRE